MGENVSGTRSQAVRQDTDLLYRRIGKEQMNRREFLKNIPFVAAAIPLLVKAGMVKDTPRTLTVPGDYPSVSDGVDAARWGDVIEIGVDVGSRDYIYTCIFDGSNYREVLSSDGGLTYTYPGIVTVNK